MEAETWNKSNLSNPKTQSAAMRFESVAITIILTVIIISGLVFYIN